MGLVKKLLKGKKDGEAEPSMARLSASDGASGSSGMGEEVYHPDSDENGGLACTNEELLKQQREAIMQWIKSMGKRLLTGNINLINTPFPVTIFEPRSYLEKLADVWVYPRHLGAAARATDPVERLKLVATWFIAGLHHAFENWRKPFNPILGETWQATLSDGTSMHMEQISHHPPVSAFHMEGPGGSYTFRGLSQPTVSIVVKYYGFKTVAKGFRCVTFPDGTTIELHYPQYYIKNVVYSSRPRAEVDGQAILIDNKNKLKAVLDFGPLKGARNKVLRRVDAVHGFIYDCSNNQESLMEQRSTADRAGEDSDRPLPSAAHRHGGDDDEEEVYESASETEWDASKEADGGEAAEQELEQVASIAAAAAAAAERAQDDDTAHEAAGRPGRYGAYDGGGEASGTQGSSPSHGLPPASKAASGSFMTSFSKMLRLSPTAPSTYNAEPEPVPGEGVPVCVVEGSWLSHVNMAGRRYWAIHRDRPDRWQPVPDPLPSDSRYRQDLVVLGSGDMKGAQRAKEMLEEMQRIDKKAREAALGIRH